MRCSALLLMLLLPLTSARAQENLFANPTFTDTRDNGAPAGWVHKGDGTVKVRADTNPPYVELGITAPGQSSFLEQWVNIPEGAVSLRLYAKYRYEGIERGEQGYMSGKVHGRFKAANGDNASHWIDMGAGAGSTDGWVERTREVPVPKDAKKLMMRVGFYEIKAGRFDVAEMRAEPITAEDLQQIRAKYRPAEPYGPKVSDERFERLKAGININGWFCQPWNQSVDGKKGTFAPWFHRSYITSEDLRMIKEMGFRHVRLPVDPIAFIDPQTGALKTELLPELDRAIQMIRDAGLAVVVDAHPKSNTFKGLSKKPLLAKSFITWWGHFAAHLHETTDPGWVFLELLNEPGGQHYWANEKWEAYQDRLITAARAGAPDHTIIINGGAYMLVKELGRVEPHPDRNTVWSIHYDGPSPFTHQGATWMKDWYRPLRDVPWPLTEDNLDEAIARLKNHPAKDKAAQVLRDQVNRGIGTRAHIEREMKQVAEWAEQNDRRIYVGEWGAMDAAPRDSRVRYLGAVSDVLNEHGFGWAMWNYSGSAFSVVQGPDNPGDRKPDWELVEALGLNPARTAAVATE